MLPHTGEQHMHAATKSTHAAAAALIRAELKANGIKSRVTSRSFAGGDAVDVKIMQDLTPAALKAVNAFVGRFEYGHFDGMTDCYNYSNRNDSLPQVKYAHVTVEYSAELKAAAAAYVADIDGISEYERDRYVWMVMSGTWGNFWQKRKPRRRFDHAAQQVAA
jgi:hypothetical protein